MFEGTITSSLKHLHCYSNFLKFSKHLKIHLIWSLFIVPFKIQSAKALLNWNDLYLDCAGLVLSMGGLVTWLGAVYPPTKKRRETEVLETPRKQNGEPKRRINSLQPQTNLYNGVLGDPKTALFLPPVSLSMGFFLIPYYLSADIYSFMLDWNVNVPVLPQRAAPLTRAMWLLFQVLLSTSVVRLAIPAIW